MATMGLAARRREPAHRLRRRAASRGRSRTSLRQRGWRPGRCPSSSTTKIASGANSTIIHPKDSPRRGVTDAAGWAVRLSSQAIRSPPGVASEGSSRSVGAVMPDHRERSGMTSWIETQRRQHGSVRQAADPIADDSVAFRDDPGDLEACFPGAVDPGSDLDGGVVRQYAPRCCRSTSSASWATVSPLNTRERAGTMAGWEPNGDWAGNRRLGRRGQGGVEGRGGSFADDAGPLGERPPHPRPGAAQDRFVMHVSRSWTAAVTAVQVSSDDQAHQLNDGQINRVPSDAHPQPATRPPLAATEHSVAKGWGDPRVTAGDRGRMT